MFICSLIASAVRELADAYYRLGAIRYAQATSLSRRRARRWSEPNTTNKILSMMGSERCLPYCPEIYMGKPHTYLVHIHTDTHTHTHAKEQ